MPSDSNEELLLTTLANQDRRLPSLLQCMFMFGFILVPGCATAPWHAIGHIDLELY